ncbi:sensor domain-containing diguanylate cyclase [Marinospirillum minutulum]|uniref:sensor domain-containing diguanylate cyclase n=1 Tax=Marinospirillum minutulum TaxID=64974 RepID=UPI000405AF0A|nr:diguanylate cyclase [Marinospirillum minutulum]
MKNHSPAFFRHFVSEWMVFSTISVFIALLLAYHQYSTHQATLLQEKGQLIRSAAASEYVIGQQLERISTTLDKIRSMLAPDWEEKAGSNKLLGERLELLSSAMPSIQVISIANKKGKTVASSKPQVVGKSFTYRNYFHVPKSTPQEELLFVSPPFEGIYGDWLIAFSKAILDEQGNFSGVVYILLNAEEYKESLSSLRPTEETWAALVHGDGLVFAWEPEVVATQGQNLARPGSLFTQHRESGREASFFSETVLANNEQSFIAVRTISPPNLYMNKPLILGVARNTAKLNQALYLNIIYIAVIYLFLNLATGLALYLSQRARQKSALKVESIEARAKNLSEQLTHFFELTPSLMAITDKEGVCQRLNPAWEKELGYTLEDFEGVSLVEYAHPEDKERFISSIRSLQDGSYDQTLMLRFRNKSGDYQYLEVFLAIQDESYFFAALDVTLRETEKERLEVLAYYDRLTGLPNRSLFFDRLQQVVARSLREKTKAALLFIDLDGFKAVNDTLGHDAGDTVLKVVSARLKGLVRKTDTVARLGGDEFVIILSQVNTEQDALSVAQKILEVVGQTIPLESGKSGQVGASIGISFCPTDGVTIDDLLMASDRAMYQSKKKGKNTFTLASENHLR